MCATKVIISYMRLNRQEMNDRTIKFV